MLYNRKRMKYRDLVILYIYFQSTGLRFGFFKRAVICNWLFKSKCGTIIDISFSYLSVCPACCQHSSRATGPPLTITRASAFLCGMSHYTRSGENIMDLPMVPEFTDSKQSRKVLQLQ